MTTLVLQPDAAAGKDTFLRSDWPTTVLGGGTNIAVGDSSPSADPINANRGLIAFDFAAIPAGAVITAAKLELWEYSRVCNDAGDYSLHKVLRDWVEGQATWNVYATGQNWGTPGCPPDDVDAEAAALSVYDMPSGVALTPLNNWMTWESTPALVAFVQAIVDGEAPNYGLLVKGAHENLPAADRAVSAFYSSDYATDPAKRPRFTVTYTEPATCPVHLLRSHYLSQGVR